MNFHLIKGIIQFNQTAEIVTDDNYILGDEQMNELGALLRTLRKERGFTLKTLSEGIISFSYLSKFEKGETQISLNNFIQLTQRLNLTVDEVLYFNETKTQNYTECFQKISLAYAKQDVAELKRYLDIEKDQYQKSKVKFHQYNATMIGAIIKDIEPSFFISENDIDQLVDYIIGCSFWTTYEISLFGNSLSLFSEKLLTILLKEIKKRVLDYKVMRKNFRDLVRLLQNASLILLREKKVDQAIAISEFSETVIESNQYFELTRKRFIEGIITIALGNQSEGNKQALRAIETMNTFDENFAQAHRIELVKYQKIYEK